MTTVSVYLTTGIQKSVSSFLSSFLLINAAAYHVDGECGCGSHSREISQDDAGCFESR